MWLIYLFISIYKFPKMAKKKSSENPKIFVFSKNHFLEKKFAKFRKFKHCPGPLSYEQDEC
jgi:hypothetical protein